MTTMVKKYAVMVNKTQDWVVNNSCKQSWLRMIKQDGKYITDYNQWLSTMMVTDVTLTSNIP